MTNVLLVFGLILLVCEVFTFTSIPTITFTLAFLVFILVIRIIQQEARIKKLELEKEVKLFKPETEATQITKVSESPEYEFPQSSQQTPHIKPAASEPVISMDQAAVPLSQPIQSESAHEQQTVSWVKSWVTTGNPIAKIGILILFFGVAFLLKYISLHIYIPVSYRLVGVFLSGLIMVLIGWKISPERKGYANIIQGGGIGLMYLSVYAAFSFYQLLQPVPAFTLLILIVILSGLIAVVRDAQSIAITGILGGFLAPLLINTGTNNHILLFSYYLLLNTGILSVAWFKSWTELNLVGFLFTFVISALWGYQSYQPEYYLSTEIFLILYFLFYVSISILFTLHQAETTNHTAKKYNIDTVITFGTPAVAFALQTGLVKDYSYGMAWSAFILALFYACVAIAIYTVNSQVYKKLSEAFSGLAVMFATITIPLTFSRIWVSTNWALESVVMLWFGIRQQQLLTRLAAGIILLASTLLYILNIQDIIPGGVYINEYYLSGLIVVLANITCSYLFYKCNKTDGEASFAWIFFILGVMGWYYVNIQHIFDYVSYNHQFVMTLIFIANSSLIAWLFAEYLAWKWLRYPALALLPLMMILSIPIYPLDFFHANGTWLAWIISFVVFYIILFRHDSYTENYLPTLHLVSFLFLNWFIATQLTVVLIQHDIFSTTWHVIIWGVVPSVLLASVCYGKKYLEWPVNKYEMMYLNYGGFVIAIYLCSWFFMTNLLSGDIPSLFYLPLFNPLDCAIALSFTAVFIWYVYSRVWIFNTIHAITMIKVLEILSVLGFIWLNAILLRSLHHWLAIPYTVADLWNSIEVQACLSIFWTVLALVETFFAARYQQRVLWFLGFSLIWVVIIKLFIVDLSSTNTLERIITFIGVGILLLINGYISPLPPKEK